jgi:glycosyltransferase involved in cell wall biosynthesis
MKYSEEDYLQILQSVKFGIWIGTHESQGFAVQEALSCNVPLVVLEATSMFDERNEQGGVTYKAEIGKYKMKATTCTYWDERCGYKDPGLETTLQNIDKMREIYSTFRPREFILEYLSPERCAKRFQYVLGLEG